MPVFGSDENIICVAVGSQITLSKTCMFFSQSLDEEERIIELY